MQVIGTFGVFCKDGPIVCNVWEKTEKDCEDEFRGFVHTFYSLLVSWFTTLEKDSMHASSLFGANSG